MMRTRADSQPVLLRTDGVPAKRKQIPLQPGTEQLEPYLLQEDALTGEDARRSRRRARRGKLCLTASISEQYHVRTRCRLSDDQPTLASSVGRAVGHGTKWTESCLIY